MKRTFLLTLIIVVVLVGMYWLPQISLFGVNLRPVDLLSELKTEEAADSTVTESQEEAQRIRQALAISDSIPEGMTPIEDFRDSLNIDREMDQFYKALRSVKKRVVRIAYFGDSFIEGDIFTANLRELLQERYGGNGVGFIDIHSQVAGFRTTIVENSTGWQDYNANERGKGFNPQLQGINSRYYVPCGSATIKAKGQNRVFPEHLDTVSTAIIYFTPDNGLKMTAMVNDEEAQLAYSRALVEPADTTDSMAPAPEYTDIRKAVVQGKIGRLAINVNGKGRFYGLALEGKNGIIVDNFSMRGSIGWHLATIPAETLKAFARLRHYDLIIMHYGLNMVTSESGYAAYCEKFKKSINNFRKAFPETSMLIISVSNRDQRNANGKFETMRGITTLVEAQRQMAQDEHIAFWNLQKAMGGSGSTYRMQQAGQANRDYTHINFKGGSVIGQIFYDVLQNGKWNYERRHSPKHSSGKQQAADQ